MKSHCYENFIKPDNASSSFWDNCALAHVNEKGSAELIPNTAYFDFADLDWSQMLHDNQEKLCFIVTLIGIGLKVANINLPKKVVIHMVFWTNFIMSIPKVFELTNRYGIDYIAYLQQAGAVYNGERDYTKLSSNLGPCFYPAGHIWHYIPAYWLHL